jgi:hypothetical protein
MTSKLLHAIVGVGIAFGSGAACGGNSQSTEDAPQGPDTSKFDPFCDATWPTTKGNPSPPACVDPDKECAANQTLGCRDKLGPLHCGYIRSSAFCIDGEWLCHPDTITETECRCYGPLAEGQVCTDMGVVDGGAG